MAIEVGNILNGTITGITKFGAFVDLGDKQTGLVHISEVANEYVENINDFLKVNDSVKVKVLSMDEKGKISLSIKQTQPKPEKPARPDRASRRDDSHGASFREKRSFDHRRNHKSSSLSFEEKMSRFMKDSDERLTDLKRNMEFKRGGRGGRRG